MLVNFLSFYTDLDVLQGVLKISRKEFSRVTNKLTKHIADLPKNREIREILCSRKFMPLRYWFILTIIPCHYIATQKTLSNHRTGDRNFNVVVGVVSGGGRTIYGAVKTTNLEKNPTN